MRSMVEGARALQYRTGGYRFLGKIREFAAAAAPSPAFGGPPPPRSGGGMRTSVPAQTGVTALRGAPFQNASILSTS